MDVEDKSSKCPMYEKCRTGRDLDRSKGVCTRYKCNTFYGIDTINVCNRIMAYLDQHSHENNGDSGIPVMNGQRVEKGIAKIVQEAVEESRRK
jgi:hypothetical protein